MALRVSLRDVASAANVSVSTASFALRNDQRVKQPTRQRVLEVAEQLGYARNPHLSHLGRRRLQIAHDERVPILLLHGGNASLNQAFFPHFHAIAKRHGYRIEDVAIPSLEDITAFGRTVYTRGYEGLILWRLQDAGILDPLPTSRLAIVGVDHFSDQPPIEIVRHDYFTPALRIYETLRERSFRRIGTLLSVHDPLNRDDHMRMGGAYAGMMSLPPEERLPILRLSLPDANTEVTHESIKRYLKRHQPDVLVFSLSAAILSLEWRLPEILRYPRVAIYVSEPAETTRYAGFTFAEPLVAETAITILDRHIRHRIHGFQRVQILHQISATWTEGPSLTPAHS